MSTATRLASALVGIALACCSGAAASAATGYAERDDVRRFIAAMVTKHGFVKQELRLLFSRARFRPAIIKAITPPTEPGAKSWQAYRALFLAPRRIQAGVDFREQHRDALRRAAALYGVPEEIIVAIIGVETVYGRNTGSYRVIDALATLAFDYPPRAEFFRGELEQFLLYARDAGIDTLGLKGSYAGAIGIPQFMPGSYRRYAVDHDGDGTSDLSASVADAIGSVANFLRAHGWERGRPVAFAAEVKGDNYRKLIDAGIKPTYRYRDLVNFGVRATVEAEAEEETKTKTKTEAETKTETKTDTKAKMKTETKAETEAEAPCALIELETPGEPSQYLVGFGNFYVLTRYNRSSMYAAVVLELAQAVKSAYPNR